MHNYKELSVWKKSIELATVVYKQTSSFPNEERFGLTSQIRRCSVSISSNIAEGSGRDTNKSFNLFLGYSYGSACELETQLIIANNIGFLNSAQFEKLNNEIQSIQKMIFSLRNKLKQ